MLIEDLSQTTLAVQLCLVAAGVFFLTALLCGVWKYQAMLQSPLGQAPVYVDIAHRSALLYSFAALLLAQFAALSQFSSTVNLVAAAAQIVFFAVAIASYILHGALKDTDNQFRTPHRLGRGTVPRAAVQALMALLIAAEVGGFVVLFAGVLQGL